MDYKDIRNLVQELGIKYYEDFIKAIISFEKGINDIDALNKIYQEFMDNDTKSIINEDFDYMIDDLRENGEIKDIPFEVYKNNINKESILDSIKKYQFQHKENYKDKKEFNKENLR